ncbi:uncharacterized protein LOC142575279 isoform X1 [Dermacentor variabilis]|uniref:uncharacterized protein LOC142575279 isoform X1 n=1 Tax=Dermacentor variabilis TaxID=34621 RepID=UPI003F5C87ED
MTPNGAQIREQSRREVYDRLHKIRLELEDLRRHCGQSDKEALEALKRTCKGQEEEIARLKKKHEEAQEQIEYLKILLSAKGADQTDLDAAETCVDHNANSQSLAFNGDESCLNQLLQGQLLDGFWAAVKHAWSMEAEKNDLNILLSKKVLELNKLQLLYSEQSKKLLEATRALSTPSSSRHTSSCDVSYK